MKYFEILKPYLIIIILFIYVIVIGNGKSVDQSLFYEVIIRPIEGALFGTFLYILNLRDSKLTFKLKFHYLIIALILILIYYSRYISMLAFYANYSISVPYLLIASPIILYICPVLVGYYLSKGLISENIHSVKK